MATLALGLAGAAVGSAFGPLGAQVGWLLGSALGSALFPEKVQGPRLDDLKLHNSTYGQMTPFLYGTMRVAGNIIDEQPELTEHSDTSGGKGGPEVTNYSYTCSFAVRLCEGPILGILRIWANGRLIYDHSGGGVTAISDDLPITIYLGDEEQLPDPTLETIHGAGNVPAYRGVAYVVFTDLLLTEFGNTLPSLNFEVYTSGGEIPIRISNFSPGAAWVSGLFGGTTYDADTGTIIVGSYVNASSGGHPAHSYSEHYFLMDGTEVGTPIVDLSMPDAVFNANICYISNAPVAAFPLASDGVGWYVNGILAVTLLSAPSEPRPYGFGVVLGSYLYCTGGPSHPSVLRFPMAVDVPAALPDSTITSPSGSTDIVYGTGDNGRLYVKAGANLWEYDANLSLLYGWDSSDWPAGFDPSNTYSGNFYRYHDMFVFSRTGVSIDKLELISIASDNTLSLYPQERGLSSIPRYEFARGTIVPLIGGYIIGKDGVTLLDPPVDPVPLSEIVADLSARAGLDESQYDVEELTDLVDGYLVNQQATARDMIQPLRDGYFFDAVERDATVVFVKRGHEASIAIPDDELAAHGDGEQAPPILGTVRGQEVDLPRVVNIDYVNAASDYQTGTQQARRQVTMSQAEVSLTLPISMSDVKAKSVADTQLYTAWVERNRFSFFTSRRYAAYEPTDVVTVGTRSMRLLEKSETRPGVVKWDAVEALAQALVQAGGSVPAIGFTPSPPGGVVVTGDTTAYLLDLPLVSDADDPDGFYAAMAWDHGAGAGLYKSADGVTYVSTATTTSRATMGSTTNMLADFTGGNAFDEANWVDVVLLYGELASSTDDGVLNGANLAVVGDEVLQFKRAELTDVLTYRLTGLLRGRLGTEFAMSSHASDEPFALLPTTLRVLQGMSELYVSRSYKAVTFNKALADAATQTFTNTGAARRPYSPVLLGGGTDGAGDVELHWTRRTRVGGGAWLAVDVPLAETEEIYQVLIWNATYTLCASEFAVFGTTSVTYTAADQINDFGATQETIFFTVSQVGTLGYGTQARGSAPGAGASNVDPLAPITPSGA